MSIATAKVHGASRCGGRIRSTRACGRTVVASRLVIAVRNGSGALLGTASASTPLSAAGGPSAEKPESGNMSVRVPS